HKLLSTTLQPSKCVKLPPVMFWIVMGFPKKDNRSLTENGE
ncbi:unnamed protein product, partial [marine sediment metagenome]